MSYGPSVFCGRTCLRRKDPMNQADFTAKVNDIGRSAFKQDTAIILLRDGARHITYTYTIEDSGFEIVTYCEVHSVSTEYLMSVRYDHIVDVLDYSTHKVE